MNLRKINNLLLILIIGINLYVLLAPLAPKIIFWWQQNHTSRYKELNAKVETGFSAKDDNKPVQPANVPTENRLVIPSMLLDEQVHEGSIANPYKALRQGIWRWPAGSTPDKGGNTVLIGHRFTYTQPKGVLYFLDKVQVGDKLAVYWQGNSYVYKVSEVKVVPATEVSIQNSTPDSRLTIFTCTPLVHPKDRLVVVAELETQ